MKWANRFAGPTVGDLKGAAAGAVGGHVAGHHALLGAASHSKDLANSGIARQCVPH
jgi:hypothetical protein